MTKPITCLFLGSGASHALAGIPMQREFLCSVLAKGRDKWIDDCDPVSNMSIGGSSLSSWMLDVKDIELCMSHLHNVAYVMSNRQPNGSLAPGEKRHATRAIVNMRAAIADYLKTFQPKPKISEKFYGWLKKLNGKNSSLVILTTNYDITLEKLLRKNRQNHYYPRVPPNNGGIPIYKLHGSINWLERRWVQNKELKSMKDILGGKRKVHQIYDPLTPLKLIRPEVDKCEWAYLFKDKPYKPCWISRKTYDTYNPILIPFFFQKDDWLEEKGGWKEIFPDLWKDAKQSLLENQLGNIYFVGYSLPPADHYMMSWLLNILNQKKPQITIVCKGNNGRLEKVLKPFDPTVYQCGLKGFLAGHV